MKFTPATPRPHRRIALVGPSGSGKTWGALTLATHALEQAALLSLESLPPAFPVSGSQPSPVAPETTPPREAVAETSPPPYSTPSETGTGTQPSGSRTTGQSGATDIEEYQEFLRGARKLAVEVLSLGVSRESIRQAWIENGGLTNVNGQFSGCPRNCWESALTALTALAEAALVETETPWGAK